MNLVAAGCRPVLLGTQSPVAMHLSLPIEYMRTCACVCVFECACVCAPAGAGFPHLGVSACLSHLPRPFIAASHSPALLTSLSQDASYYKEKELSLA